MERTDDSGNATLKVGLVEWLGGFARTRTVLGDSRVADVHPGDGFPWINCPFCSSPVYLREPHPDHHAVLTIGQHGTCGHGWCLANPKMPLDAARLARGEAHLEEMRVQASRRNHCLAMDRIAEDLYAEEARLSAGRDKCIKLNACFACWRKTGRFIKHRKECTR